MARLPDRTIPKSDDVFSVITSIALSPGMSEQLLDEAKRTGARGRSEMIRWIVEEYFKQPIKEEDDRDNWVCGDASHGCGEPPATTFETYQRGETPA